MANQEQRPTAISTATSGSMGTWRMNRYLDTGNFTVGDHSRCLGWAHTLALIPCGRRARRNRTPSVLAVPSGGRRVLFGFVVPSLVPGAIDTCSGRRLLESVLADGRRR